MEADQKKKKKKTKMMKLKRSNGELAEKDDDPLSSSVRKKRRKLSRFFTFRAEKMLLKRSRKSCGRLRRSRESILCNLEQLDRVDIVSSKEESSKDKEVKSSMRKEEEEKEEEEEEEKDEEEEEEEVEAEEEEEGREGTFYDDSCTQPFSPQVEREAGAPTIPIEWENVVKSVVDGSTTNAVIIVCGGKNVGKSTFARYLVNSMLTRYQNVGFLDTDVGQPELTPPGLLSFHLLDKPIAGLPKLEMKNPERCYFFGDISAKSNPDDYLTSIFSLHHYFRHKYHLRQLENGASVPKETQTPLVINTHGWIQGVGLDVLANIIGHVMPTHVIQIRTKSARRNLPTNQFWESKETKTLPELLFVDSVIEEHAELAEIKFNARELRDLRMLFYFQKGLKEDGLLETSQFRTVFSKAAISLASSKPFQVPISAIKVEHQHEEVPLCESIYSLNAALVGLGISSGSGKGDMIGQGIKPNCVGLGIVRGIDTEKGVLYVISPLVLEELQQVDIFLQGKIEIPVALLQTPGYVSPYLCHNVISIEGTGSAVIGSGRKKWLRT